MCHFLDEFIQFICSKLPIDNEVLLNQRNFLPCIMRQDDLLPPVLCALSNCENCRMQFNAQVQQRDIVGVLPKHSDVVPHRESSLNHRLFFPDHPVGWQSASDLQNLQCSCCFLPIVINLSEVTSSFAKAMF